MLLAAGAANLWAPAAGAQSPAQGPGGPVLVVTGPDLNVSGQSFGSYYAEILRAEGLNEFAVTDKGNLSASALAGYQVVLLASTSLNDAQVGVLTNWVQGGGNLIAMRPDPRLAGAARPRCRHRHRSRNAYLQVATGAPPGAGIIGQTMQFHGTADDAGRGTRRRWPRSTPTRRMRPHSRRP